MNSASHAIPGFRTIYWVDFTIQRAFNGMIGGLIVAAGIWWASQPVPNALPQAEPTPEAIFAPLIVVAGLVFSALAGIVLVRRYLLVKKILRHGAPMRGKVEAADVFDTNRRSERNTMRTRTTYAYYVSIRYAVHGIEEKIRVKLPHSPGTYGLKEDGDVELLVLPDLPKKPLIRPLYLGRRGQ